jgi:cyclic dehypoxanthinyl futalosine synthase
MSETPYSIDAILHKIGNGTRINYDEGLLLYEKASLHDLADAAEVRRQQINPGRIATYLIDRNINYTNVCITDCQFCNFYAPHPTHKKAYVNSKAILGRKIEEALQLGATRILMQGGHHPDLPFEYYLDLVSWIKQTYPVIEIDAFSPSEIEHISKISGKSWHNVLVALKEAGLEGLPGGGGEILDDQIRNRVSPKKITTNNWLGIMREAHRLDLTTTATMVIGLTEGIPHRMNHLQRLRDVQDEAQTIGSRGFNAFISWSVQIENTPLGRSRYRDQFGATAQEYLRHTAIARIFLDNIPHISASWPTQGVKVAQIALHFGCDDFGSTMIEENVVSAAGAPTAVQCSISVAEIHHQIRDAGYLPAQRNTRYEIVRAYDTADIDNSLPARQDTGYGSLALVSVT